MALTFPGLGVPLLAVAFILVLFPVPNLPHEEGWHCREETVKPEPLPNPRSALTPFRPSSLDRRFFEVTVCKQNVTLGRSVNSWHGA